MSKVIQDLKYTKEHEWLKKLDNGNYLLGITDYAQNSLGDIVYIDIPDAGTSLQKDASLGTIESVKAVSDIYSPIDGSVSLKNEGLADDPALVNSDPYEKGWLLEIKAGDDSQWDSLLSASDYEALLSDH